MPSLPKLPFGLASASTISKQRVYYSQPSSVKPDLMPLYQRLAKDLDLTPAAVRAFAVVESDEKPFAPNGMPLIRLETHHWIKRRIATREAMVFDKAKNSKDQGPRWEQFMRMRSINEVAAIQCHSFGMFQICGFNFKLCLCADPVTFLSEMTTLEGQAKMFKRFMLSSPALLAAARMNRPDQVGFHYNGPQYKKNKYDSKYAAATKAGGSLAWA